MFFVTAYISQGQGIISIDHYGLIKIGREWGTKYIQVTSHIISSWRAAFAYWNWLHLTLILQVLKRVYPNFLWFSVTSAVLCPKYLLNRSLFNKWIYKMVISSLKTHCPVSGRLMTTMKLASFPRPPASLSSPPVCMCSWHANQYGNQDEFQGWEVAMGKSPISS